MLYEIINMSDPYTIEANSLDVAFVACAFLGAGQYAFQPLQEGGEEVPLFIFRGSEEWCQEHFQNSVTMVTDRVLTDEKKRAELADCFDSCLIGKPEDRTTYQLGLNLIEDADKLKQWRDEWHDKRRSSMNDIGGRAYRMAKKLRQGEFYPLIKAPTQVFTGGE